MKNSSIQLCLSFCLLFTSTSLYALSSDEAQNLLDDFEKSYQSNPQETMNRVGKKTPLQGNGAPSPFELRLKNYDFVVDKDSWRKKICFESSPGVTECLEDVPAGRAPIMGGDLAEELIGSNFSIKSILTMDKQNLKSAKLDETPWSDYYWPIYSGILGARYGEYRFSNSEDWLEHLSGNFQYKTKDKKVTYIGERKRGSSIDNLSPSEKYDLLVGDADFTLTKAMWAQGQMYYNQNNQKVEKWMGICHGWAAAAFMLQRPTNKITVKAANGNTWITFYPSDIKALASLLWANIQTPSYFIGGRCNTKEPKTDKPSGRIKDQECFDNNPGSWHKAVVNLIGKKKQSFVMDATYDYEVWNQPVYSYNYQYFNPVTMKQTDSIDQATVSKSDFKSSDKFKNFRDYSSSKFKNVIGVIMEVAYVLETEPTHAATDSPQKDYVTTAKYIYDLELNKNGSITGGEWYSNTHPDFLWRPAKKHAYSKVDQASQRVSSHFSSTQGLEGEYLKLYNYAKTEWDGETAFPQQWSEVAPMASSYKNRYGQHVGQPLTKVVETLITLSRANLK